MAQDDRRVVAVGVVHDVDIGAADAAICDLYFDLRLSAGGLFDIQDIEVAIAGGIFYEGSHKIMWGSPFGLPPRLRAARRAQARRQAESLTPLIDSRTSRTPTEYHPTPRLHTEFHPTHM